MDTILEVASEPEEAPEEQVTPGNSVHGGWSGAFTAPLPKPLLPPPTTRRRLDRAVAYS